MCYHSSRLRALRRLGLVCPNEPSGEWERHPNIELTEDIGAVGAKHCPDPFKDHVVEAKASYASDPRKENTTMSELNSTQLPEYTEQHDAMQAEATQVTEGLELAATPQTGESEQIIAE